MSISLIQAVIDGRKMQDVALDIDTSPSKLSLLLQTEMNAVAKHTLNSHLSKELSVRNAFAIRRNKRTWSLALANATSKQNLLMSVSPIQHVFSANSIDEAFDIALNHDSITKKDAMILMYNTTIKAIKNEL